MKTTTKKVKNENTSSVIKKTDAKSENANEKKVASATKSQKNVKTVKTNKVDGIGSEKKTEKIVVKTTRNVKPRKVVPKKKKEVEEPTFEESAFASEKKEPVIKISSNMNILPIIVGLLCVLLVVAIFFLMKNKKIKLVESKKAPIPITSSIKKQAQTTTTAKEVVKKVEEVVKETEDNATKIVGKLKEVMPYYLTDIYSEGALYGYSKNDIEAAKKEIDDLVADNSAISKMTEDQKNILLMNKIIIDRYISEYNVDYVNKYDNAADRDQMEKIISAKSVKYEKYGITDYTTVSFFENAIDQGFYYDIPSIIYKKTTVNKKIFDEMEDGTTASLTLPAEGSGEKKLTTITKVSDKKISYIDQSGEEKFLNLVPFNDSVYVLQREENNSYVLVEADSDIRVLSVLKNARVGHGTTMENIAKNYLKYPNEIPYEVYVSAEEIVNKTSTNTMLNDNTVNSSKQVWDDKGFVVSLIYFE